MRSNNRKPDSLRPISIERGLQYQADGSVLIRMGNTHVICGVSVEEKVPPFLQDSRTGLDNRGIRYAPLCHQWSIPT